MDWAIYMLIFGLPSYLIRFEVGPLPMTVLEGMILILFGIWVVKSFKHLSILTFKQFNFQRLKRWAERWKGLLGTIILFLFSASVAVVVSPETKAAMGLWKAYFVEPILFFIVFISVIQKDKLKNIIWALAGSSAVVSLVAWYQKLTGNWIANEFWAAEATRRVSGFFPYPNALALYLGPIVVLLIGLLVKSLGEEKKEKLLNCYIIKLLGWGIVILDLMMIYWSGSKGAMLGIAAGIVFYALFWAGKRKYFWPIVVIGILMGAWLWQSGRINLKGNYSVEGGDSISVRTEMWQESWQMIKDHYVWGAGLAGYQSAMTDYHQKKYIEIYLYPHNIFLNFWSEIGLLGLVAIVAITVWFYKIGLAKRDKEDLRFMIYDLRIILMAAMTVIIVHGLVDAPYFKNDLSVFFWLMVGMMWIGGVRQKEIDRV